MLKRDWAPRQYQEEMLAAASKANTLVVLPTALGKTVIALLLAILRLQKVGGKVLVLAPTKPLVQQHQKSFLEKTELTDVVVLTGAEPPEERIKLWNENKIICATPQTVRNDLVSKRYDLSDVSLVVFDEAHHAVKGYAYVYLARKYMESAKHPLILGLTASPGSLKNEIEELCNNLYITKIESRTEEELGEFVPKIDIEWRKVDVPQEFLKVKENLENVLRGFLKSLKVQGYLVSADLSNLRKQDLLFARKRILTEHKMNYSAIAAVASCIKLTHAIELLETQGLDTLHRFFEKLRTDKQKSSQLLFTVDDFRRAITITDQLLSQGMDHPKLRVLLDIVKSTNSQVIVFSHYRSQVQKIAALLRTNDITAGEFLGQKEGFTQKKQKQAVADFRESKFRVLVATSVGEEGIDIPTVDLVVFYEPVPSEIRYIQRRGRTARQHSGKAIVLIARGTKDEAYYWIAQRGEKRMHSELRKVELRDSQHTLQRFVGEEQPTIMVDTREVPSGLVEKLSELVTVNIKQLELADFLVGDRVAVERKTASDFVGSMIDGRLFSQVADLAKSFETPILLIEGYDLYNQRNVHPNAIRGALVSIAVDYHVPIIFSKDVDDTASILYTIARREHEERRPLQIKGKRTGATLSEQQQALVAALPDINTVLAERLLSHFGSPERVFTASEDELQKVHGIGEKIAKRIREVLTKTYHSD